MIKRHFTNFTQSYLLYLFSELWQYLPRPTGYSFETSNCLSHFLVYCCVPLQPSILMKVVRPGWKNFHIAHYRRTVLISSQVLRQPHSMEAVWTLEVVLSWIVNETWIALRTIWSKCITSVTIRTLHGILPSITTLPLCIKPCMVLK